MSETDSIPLCGCPQSFFSLKVLSGTRILCYDDSSLFGLQRQAK